MSILHLLPQNCSLSLQIIFHHENQKWQLSSCLLGSLCLEKVELKDPAGRDPQLQGGGRCLVALALSSRSDFPAVQPEKLHIRSRSLQISVVAYWKI